MGLGETMYGRTQASCVIYKTTARKLPQRLHRGPKTPRWNRLAAKWERARDRARRHQP